MRRYLTIFTALLISSAAAFGQLTNVLENGTSQTISNVWNVAGDIIVGNITSNNLLNIINGGDVDSVNAYIGNSNSAMFNAVSIAGTNAKWQVSGSLVVGNEGSDNSLIVTNGGRLTSARSYIGFGSNAFNNVVVVTGSNTLWSNLNDLEIGVSGTGNTLRVEDDGKVTVGNDLRVSKGNSLNLDFGNVEVGGNLFVNSNAVVSGSGSVAFDAGSNFLVFDYVNSTISSNVLFDGQAGADTIQLSGGGQDVSAADFSFLNHTNFSVLQLADGDDAWLVSASDTNGTFGSISNIYGGAGNDRLKYNPGDEPSRMADSKLGKTYFDFEILDLGAGSNNWEITALDSGILLDGGAGDNSLWSTGGVLTVTTNDFSSAYVNFSSMGLTNTTLTGQGIVDGVSSISMSGGTLNPNGSLQIDGEFSADQLTYMAHVGAVASDQLYFTSTNGVDLSSITATVVVAKVPTNALKKATILVADGGYNAGGFAETNITDSLLLYDASMTNLSANTIEIVVAGNGEKFSSALAFAGAEGVRAGFNSMKNLVFTRTKQLRRNLVATSHAIPREAFLLSSTNAPAGARGPGDQSTIFDFNLWVQHFSGEGDYERSGDSHGFSMNSYGTTFGFDKLIGDALVVGANYTYSRTHSRTTNDDQLDTETYWVGAYGEWVGEEGLYVDALAGYGFSSFDSLRVEVDEGYLGTALYGGYGLGGYVDVGQYYHYKNVALSPYAGVHYLSVVADEHMEDGPDELTVAEFSHAWLESVLGIKLRHRFNTQIGRFQTTGYAEWAHDYIQEDIYSTLSANGLPAVDMARISPDADMFNTGLGFSWLCTDSLEVGVGYNGRFSDRYEEHTGSVMLNLMF